jgi:hypothetical protein
VTIEVSSVLSQNITLLFDSLDLKTIDGSKLKSLVGDKGILMDTPEMIVAADPITSLIIQLGDNRTRITLQQEGKEMGDFPLWRIARDCRKLARQSQLTAYGFNYDLGAIITEGNAQTVTLDIFVPNKRQFEDVLGARFVSFIPRLRFKRGETLYDLVLEPLDERRIRAHLNAHFEVHALPPLGQLRDSFRQELSYLIEIFPKLFQGGNS